MKIKRIEHIAIAVKSMAPLKALLQDKLGIAMEYEENLPQYNTKLQMYPIGQTYLELLESDKPDTATNRWISPDAAHRPDRRAILPKADGENWARREPVAQNWAAIRAPKWRILAWTVQNASR